jgi:hypothetical protein
MSFIRKMVGVAGGAGGKRDDRGEPYHRPLNAKKQMGSKENDEMEASFVSVEEFNGLVLSNRYTTKPRYVCSSRR